MAFISQRICNIHKHNSIYKQLLLHNNLNKTTPLTQNILCRHEFWERSRRSGYERKDNTPILTHLKNGAKLIKGEVKMWVKEMKDMIETDPLLVARPGM